MREKRYLLYAALALILLAAGCAAKKDDSEHFGVKQNFPVFKGPGDFFKSLNRVSRIINKNELDGKPVEMSWIDPRFREQLCLVVTINNHCGGG